MGVSFLRGSAFVFLSLVQWGTWFKDGRHKPPGTKAFHRSFLPNRFFFTLLVSPIQGEGENWDVLAFTGRRPGKSLQFDSPATIPFMRIGYGILLPRKTQGA